MSAKADNKKRQAKNNKKKRALKKKQLGRDKDVKEPVEKQEKGSGGPKQEKRKPSNRATRRGHNAHRNKRKPGMNRRGLPKIVKAPQPFVKLSAAELEKMKPAQEKRWAAICAKRAAVQEKRAERKANKKPAQRKMTAEERARKKARGPITKAIKKQRMRKRAMREAIKRRNCIMAARARSTSRFQIRCRKPVEDEIFDVDEFVKYIKERFKFEGKTGQVGAGRPVNVSKSVTTVHVMSKKPFAKAYLKFLTKSYLKRHGLRDYVRVIADKPRSYELRYFNIQEDGK